MFERQTNFRSTKIFNCAAQAACFSVSGASAVLGQRNFLENSMQPDVVAKTLTAVQGEWKAQVAIFADCDTTAKLPGSPIVNCKDYGGGEGGKYFHPYPLPPLNLDGFNKLFKLRIQENAHVYAQNTPFWRRRRKVCVEDLNKCMLLEVQNETCS